jgi:hypothetical protein
MIMNTLGPEFTKGSRSNNNGACIEVRMIADDGVEMRNSRNPTGPTLLFAAAQYDAFLNSIIAGELRRP